MLAGSSSPDPPGEPGPPGAALASVTGSASSRERGIHARGEDLRAVTKIARCSGPPWTIDQNRDPPLEALLPPRAGRLPSCADAFRTPALSRSRWAEGSR